MRLKNCKKCGHPNPMENRFCSECGTVFKNMVTQNAVSGVDVGKDGSKSNGFKYTAIVACAILVLAILIVPNLPPKHSHVWKAATCIQPQTCIECGETEGVAIEHTWQAADCTVPKTCIICGKTEGIAFDHSWLAADCTMAMTCEICGETKGNALGHSWVDATLHAPATCEVCGETEGKSLGYALTWYPYAFSSNEAGSSSDVNIGTWIDTRGNTYINAIKFWVMDSYGMSNSEYVEYVLSESYNELALTIAAEENSMAGTLSKILVYADGKLIYESPEVGNNTPPIETTLNISNANQLRIVCTTDSESSCYCIVTAFLYK